MTTPKSTGDGSRTLFSFAGTPVRIQTWWLTVPTIPLAAWGLMAALAGRRRPARSTGERLAVGALTGAIVIGSEWGHNLAHAASARLTGAPMDALYVMGGMPRVFYTINDARVSPRQHVLRALGGPLFNGLLWLVSALLRRRTAPDSLAREALDAACAASAFICTAGLMPLPGLDGGPILKWALVRRGHSPEDADRFLEEVDLVLGAALITAGIVVLPQRRWPGLGLLGVGLMCLAIALGFVKEEMIDAPLNLSADA